MTDESSIEPPTSSDDDGTSRRTLLGILTAAGGIGAVGSWFGYTRLTDDQNTTDEGANNPSPDSDSGDQETAVWEQEQAVRDRLHATLPSLTPSFNYDPFSQTVDDSASPIQRVSLAPGQDGAGDHAVFVAEQTHAQQLADFVVVTWGDPEEALTAYETTVNGRVQQFDIYTGGDIAVATALRTQPETAQHELFVARAEDEPTVETLVDTFDAFYRES